MRVCWLCPRDSISIGREETPFRAIPLKRLHSSSHSPGPRLAAVFAVVMAALASGTALAFGPEGHSIVAEIAHRRLSPAATRHVQELLGGNASLASIASWADDVRDQRPETANWHFVDIPLAERGYSAARDCRSRDRGDCIVQALPRALAALRDAHTAKPERIEALMFVVHFVADLHQPLHAVQDDRGGNTFPVKFFLDPRRQRAVDTNLHQVWDFGLIRSQVWDWGAYVMRLESDWLQRADRVVIRAGSIAEWATESHDIAAIAVFAGVERGATLGDDYIARARPWLDRQLGIAGLRLAALLNDALR